MIYVTKPVMYTLSVYVYHQCTYVQGPKLTESLPKVAGIQKKSSFWLLMSHLHLTQYFIEMIRYGKNLKAL